MEQVLLAEGAQVDQTNDGGFTPLHWAARQVIGVRNGGQRSRPASTRMGKRAWR